MRILGIAVTLLAAALGLLALGLLAIFVAPVGHWAGRLSLGMASLLVVLISIVASALAGIALGKS